MNAPRLPIQTDRLVLRAHRRTDVDDLLAYYSRPDVARFIPWEPWTREEAEERVAARVDRLHLEDADSRLSLVIEHDARVIGDVVLWASDDTMSKGEMGWALHPAYHGRGFATEAAAALLDVAFTHYGMHRVVARMDVENRPSALVCERLGMTREGCLRRDHLRKGRWTDNVVYGLLSAEWALWNRPGSPHGAAVGRNR